jgi:hypothetical protein
MPPWDPNLLELGWPGRALPWVSLGLSLCELAHLPFGLFGDGVISGPDHFMVGLCSTFSLDHL